MDKSAARDEMTNDKIEVLKAIGDLSAGSIVIGTLAKVLPPLAALFAVLWYCIGFYEKITGKPFSESKLAKLFTRRGDK